MKKIILLVNTVKFLKSIQIYYRFYYLLRAKIRKIIGFQYPLSQASSSVELNFQRSIYSYESYRESNEFKFLNLSTKFHDNIDWNYAQYGKLWTYNLNYFDFLNQEKNYPFIGVIEDFIDNQEYIKDGFESFPISLRGINWIKYLTYHNVKNRKIDDSLYAQYFRLVDSLEYHLLGNHLLENSFSLLFGAYYFEDENLYKVAKKILVDELEEQILADGAHFELSPMYHQIMLYRVLDCINLIEGNSWKNRELLPIFRDKAEIMLGWLKNISYENGDIPLLNDSANGIAPTTNELFEYAKRLELITKKIDMKECGYRKISTDSYELILDVGDIGPDYIPGHAHSDTFNFELHINGRPFIMDTGLSTYETNERRTTERSTSSHNTVEINGKNQSEVWGGFRVGNRAKIIDLIESKSIIEASHNGYLNEEKILHTRKWSFEKGKIVIEDSLNKASDAVARLHFHPSVEKEDILKSILISTKSIKFETYQFAPAFNTLQSGICLVINFDRTLKVEIVS